MYTKWCFCHLWFVGRRLKATALQLEWHIGIGGCRGGCLECGWNVRGQERWLSKQAGISIKGRLSEREEGKRSLPWHLALSPSICVLPVDPNTVGISFVSVESTCSIDEESMTNFYRLRNDYLKKLSNLQLEGPKILPTIMHWHISCAQLSTNNETSKQGVCAADMNRNNTLCFPLLCSSVHQVVGVTCLVCRETVAPPSHERHRLVWYMWLFCCTWLGYVCILANRSVHLMHV